MTIRRVLLGLFVVTTTAGGQIPAVAVPALPARDSVPAFERPNGALLRPGTLTYAITLTRPDGLSTPLGTRTVTVSETTLGGSAGWLIDDTRRGTAVETSDSVYLVRADLTPERWTATIGRAQLGASFTRDTMFGVMDTYRGRSSFALSLPPGALLSAGMTERIIELLPLRLGYHAGAALLLLGGEYPHATPAEILVDREERVSVGARSADCWVVTLRAGAREQRLWVSRDGARVVRTEQTVAGGTLTSALLP